MLEPSRNLKSSKNLWQPDPRALSFGLQEPTVDMYINWMTEANLTKDVPDSIRQYFDSARNSFIYSFYDYGMSMPAQLYAFSLVERALKKRFTELGIKFQDGSGLGAMFKIAKANNFLTLDSFNADSRMHQWVHGYSHFWADHGGAHFIYKEPAFIKNLYQIVNTVNKKLNTMAAKVLKALRVRGKFNEAAHKTIKYCTKKMKMPLGKIARFSYKIQKKRFEAAFPPFEGKRNLLAHGEEIMDLPWEGYHTILLCAHTINSIYHPSITERHQ